MRSTVLEPSRKPSRKDCAKARAVTIEALKRGALSASFVGENDRYEFEIVRDKTLPYDVYVLFGPHGFVARFNYGE